MEKQKIYFRFLSIMFIVTAFLPVVHENLPKGIGSFRFFWAPLWLGSLLVFKKEVFTKKVVFYFLVYGVCLLFFIPTFWHNMDDWLSKYIKEEFYWIFTIVCVLYYYFTVKDYEGLNMLIRISLVFIGITAVLSIIASSINPLYARLITGVSNRFRDTQEGMFFIKMGAGQYSFGQSLICLFPILIYYYKQGSTILFSKRVLLLYIVLLYFTVIRMQFFANIILATLAIIISFLGSRRIRLSLFIIVCVLIVAVVIPRDFYTNILLSVSTIFDKSSENYHKITDMSEFVAAGGNLESGTTANRLSRYSMLYQTFIKSPVFGNAASPDPDEIGAGYHLHWMGKLAATGIVGLILFLWPNYFYIKSCIKRFHKNYAFFAAISFVAFFALGLMKTISGRDIWFTYLFLIPGMYYLPLLNRNKKDFL